MHPVDTDQRKCGLPSPGDATADRESERAGCREQNYHWMQLHAGGRGGQAMRQAAQEHPPSITAASHQGRPLQRCRLVLQAQPERVVELRQRLGRHDDGDAVLAGNLRVAARGHA